MIVCTKCTAEYFDNAYKHCNRCGTVLPILDRTTDNRTLPAVEKVSSNTHAQYQTPFGVEDSDTEVYSNDMSTASRVMWVLFGALGLASLPSLIVALFAMYVEPMDVATGVVTFIIIFLIILVIATFVMLIQMIPVFICWNRNTFKEVFWYTLLSAVVPILWYFILIRVIAYPKKGVFDFK